MAITISIPGASGYGLTDGTTDSEAASDVLYAAHLIAMNFPGNTPALAKHMGVSANTLKHKLNPNNDTHHLTLREAVLMQRAAGSAGVLHAMARSLGYTCVPGSPDQWEGDPVEVTAHLQYCLGDFFKSFADAIRDGGPVTPNEQRRCAYHAQEVIAAVGHMLSCTAARVPKRNKE